MRGPMGSLPKPDEQAVKLWPLKLWKLIALMASASKTRYTFSLKRKGRRRLKSRRRSVEDPPLERRRTMLAVLILPRRPGRPLLYTETQVPGGASSVLEPVSGRAK